MEPQFVLFSSLYSTSFKWRFVPQVAIMGIVVEKKVMSLFRRSAGHKVVENMEVSFPGWWCRDSGLFQIVGKSFGSGQSSSTVELKLGIFAKSRGISVLVRASTSKGLEYVLDWTSTELVSRVNA